jgi:hypothetical protein
MSLSGNGAADTPMNVQPGLRVSSAAPRRFALERDQWGQLVFIADDGIRHSPVAPTPLFPLSAPEQWISIRGSDGIELACNEDASFLDADTQRLLKEE